MNTIKPVAWIALSFCGNLLVCCRDKQGSESTKITADQPSIQSSASLTSRSLVATPDCPDGMTKIPGGLYRMEKTRKFATVKAFCMDLTEVTTAAFAACKSCSTSNEGEWCNFGRSDRSEHPINCVDFTKAKLYCASLGKRLPSEEEWEWAARGGELAHEYPWGNAVPSNQLCWNGNGNDKGKGSRSSTCPVKAFPKGNNRWGVSDLSGNVWEWTVGSSVENEKVPVARGGSWANNEDIHIRVSFRIVPPGVQHLYDVGFRCVR